MYVPTYVPALRMYMHLRIYIYVYMFAAGLRTSVIQLHVETDPAKLPD